MSLNFSEVHIMPTAAACIFSVVTLNSTVPYCTVPGRYILNTVSEVLLPAGALLCSLLILLASWPSGRWEVGAKNFECNRVVARTL
jgi:hypothetical protein